MRERRADPGDDLVSTLVNGEFQGRTLEQEEILSFLRLLFPAGTHNTTNAIGNLFFALLERPALFAGVYRALRPGGLFAFPIGAPPPVTSGWYWALLGFDLAMRLRNAVWRPPFVMYYRTTPLLALRDDLTAAGFTVQVLPLTDLGSHADGAPRFRLFVARKPER